MPDRMLDNAVCPLCGAPDGRLVYDLRAARSPDDVPGVVVRCRSCPMWFKALAEPGALPEDYPGEHGDEEMARAYLASEAARALFRDSLADVASIQGGPRPRLLDIGAAQGALLQEALRMGFDAEGLDRSAANVREAGARGLRIAHGAVEDLDCEDTFDVITMLDVIEHVTDPMRVLRNANRALKPGGQLVVYTPNHRAAVVVLAKLLGRLGIRYPVREIFGRNHVSFFDDRSLSLALQKSGFEERRRRYLPYDPARPGQYVSPLNLAVVRFAEWLGRPFDRVFRMLVWARKPCSTPPRLR